MAHPILKPLSAVGVLVAIGLLVTPVATAQPVSLAPTDGDGALIIGIDRVFARWNSATLPGCTVGLSRDGKDVITRAYGMADLEHGVPNKPDSIIEAGSVSKQFTAAAVLLLVQQGKVSLDDAVRRYIPELPDYGAPLTIRHILTHTSGLRDWGSIEGIVGWPRTSRAYTHAHVLDIVSRQRALNFPSGSAYSYSNTGYNLAAILISRVSGRSFADFTRENLFEPLGMTRTSWRDDFTRVVRDRSIAYSVSATGVATMDMPFENVHGNGGLLTTVGDLLRWNDNAITGKVGGRALIDLQRQTMKLTDGSSIEYAFGLRISNWDGVPEVAHSGSTAGYRAWLGQYPTKGWMSVAVLCNAANASPTALGHDVAHLAMAGKQPVVRIGDYAISPEPMLTPFIGLFLDRRRNDVVDVVLADHQLRTDNLGVLMFANKNKLGTAGSGTLEFERDANGKAVRMRMVGAEVVDFDRVEKASPTAAELDQYAGEYTSDEAELTLRVAVENGALVIRRRPDTTFTLAPTYKDAFTSDLGGIRFLRDRKGAITEMSISVDRVWDLRFKRK
ncbi:MAG: serine hydrolase domain-containing protein [Vicinamibacteria bacterium]